VGGDEGFEGAGAGEGGHAGTMADGWGILTGKIVGRGKDRVLWAGGYRLAITTGSQGRAAPGFGKR
jgi:hypothetical protein